MGDQDPPGRPAEPSTQVVSAPSPEPGMLMDWILTYTDRAFRPLDPDPASVDIRDIAHSLALLCRFNGHCKRFYSVAEHSVRVSLILPPELALAGLLHDAAEAYLSDLPRPVKHQIPSFEPIEERLLEVIAARFGLTWPLPDAVWQADDVLLVTEMRDIMGPPPTPVGMEVEPLDEQILPVGPTEAEALFLARYAELTPLSAT